MYSIGGVDGFPTLLSSTLAGIDINMQSYALLGRNMECYVLIDEELCSRRHRNMLFFWNSALGLYHIETQFSVHVRHRCG